jgi:predicted nicotinamide N-methyase
MRGFKGRKVELSSPVPRSREQGLERKGNFVSSKRKTDVLCHGVHALSSGHHDIRILKRQHAPLWFGYRVWASSWLLMDFLKRYTMPVGSRVMELGCGWGLAGIYCAKTFGAVVTGVDKDPEVVHYLHRHSEINEVEIATINLGFEDLTREHLKGVKVLIGADICFWDSMVDPIRQLISRAMDEGVRLVVPSAGLANSSTRTKAARC